MKKLNVSIIILIVILGGACTPKTDVGAPTFTNDPRIPGGIIGTAPVIQPVINFLADPSTPLQIKLTWQFPSLYLTSDHSIVVFKNQCAGDGILCSPPNPATTTTVPVYSGPLTAFTDINVQVGAPLTYWAFLKLDQAYSLVSTVRTIALPGISSLNNISASNFWTNIGFKIGSDHSSSATLSPSANNLAAVKIVSPNIGGKMASSMSGAVLYYADTANNRIVTMIKQIALQCASANFTDPLELQFCMIQSIGEPYIPWNVLGQPDQRTSLSCQDHQVSCQASSLNVKEGVVNGKSQWQLFSSPTATSATATYANKNDAYSAACDQENFCSYEGTAAAKTCNVRKDECMTAPTHVIVDGDKLLVSDSGNDRILIYDQLPIRDGCDTNLGSDLSVPRNCTATRVIGKKSPLDLNPYVLSVTDGNRTLSAPGAMAVRDGNLYIADRGNNRVVRARGYNDKNLYSCESTTTSVANGLAFGSWHPLCKFDAVLGQPTFSQKTSFKDIVLDKAGQDIDVISGGNGNVLTSDYQNLLKRYFGSPSALAFAEGKLLISSYEDFRFDQPELLALKNAGKISEDFYARRVDKSAIALKSRILIFDENKIVPIQPDCQPSLFDTGGCDAEAVTGQLNFDTIPVFSGDSAEDYKAGISYGLTYVTDFIVDGKTMMAVDALTNDIYFWHDWTNPVQGRPFNFRIENPLGAIYQNTTTLPNLKSISGILFNPLSGDFTVSDPGAGRLYTVKRPK
jgi:hypothetical protein